MRQLAVVLAFVVMVTVNALANILPINGQQTGELSDKYPSLFTPAGYVFSIWGVIYLLLGAYVVFQILPSQRSNPRLGAVGYLFVGNALANASWIYAWHYEQLEVSLGVMLLILGSLIVIYRGLNVGSERVGQGETVGKVPAAERWTAHLAFSVYLGWITVATVANVSVVLIDNGFDGGSFAAYWTAATIAVAASIGVVALKQRGDVAFAAVLVWAFIGIAVKQSGEEMVIVVAAGLAAAALVAGSLQKVIKSV